MNEGLIPRRYAKALLKVAQEKNCEKKVYSLMKTLAMNFSLNPQLDTTMENPFIKDDQKMALLITAAGADNTDVLYSDFLKLLIQNKRISEIRDIALAYQQVYRKTNHIYVVNVESATELMPDEIERLRSIILNHLPQGSQIEFTTSVNPELIGGFVVNIDNERLDASIKNELKQLRLKLISN